MWVVLAAVVLGSAEASASKYTICTKRKTIPVAQQDLARYVSSGAVDAKADKLAALMGDDKPVRSEAPHGKVELLIRRTTMEPANLEHFTFVWVDRDGKKIGQVNGPVAIAEPPPAIGPFGGSASYWWNRADLNVPRAGEGVELHVVDRLHVDKCVFVLGKKGTEMRVQSGRWVK